MIPLSLARFFLEKTLPVSYLEWNGLGKTASYDLPGPDVSHGASPADVVRDWEGYLSMQAPKGSSQRFCVKFLKPVSVTSL